VLEVAAVDDSLVASLVARLAVRPVTARCLAVRGVGVDDAATFLSPRLAGLRKPEGMAGFAPAVERIAAAVIAGDAIGVFGD